MQHPLSRIIKFPGLAFFKDLPQTDVCRIKLSLLPERLIPQPVLISLCSLPHSSHSDRYLEHVVKVRGIMPNNEAFLLLLLCNQHRFLFSIVLRENKIESSLFINGHYQ